MPRREQNAHNRRAASAPARDPGPAPFLPIDLPPITSRLPASALVGLVWEFDTTTQTPVERPWTPYQSVVFPDVYGSNVGPAAIVPRYGYSENHFSPVPHRPLSPQPVPIRRPLFAGYGRRSLGRSTGRIRGKVTTSPAVNPLFRSMFSNAMIDGPG